MAFGERILVQPIELIDGVEETLALLVERHDLTLMTKGHPEEQRLKIDRSGLDELFPARRSRSGEGRLRPIRVWWRNWRSIRRGPG